MMTWEDILGKTRDAAEYVGKKTEDFVELTKLRLALSDTEKELAATMEGLGRLVYDARKSGADVTALLDEAVATADALQKKAEGLREQIYAYKKVKRCAACQAINREDAAYCKACGAKLGE